MTGRFEKWLPLAVLPATKPRREEPDLPIAFIPDIGWGPSRRSALERAIRWSRQ